MFFSSANWFKSVHQPSRAYAVEQSLFRHRIHLKRSRHDCASIHSTCGNLHWKRRSEVLRTSTSTVDWSPAFEAWENSVDRYWKYPFDSASYLTFQPINMMLKTFSWEIAINPTKWKQVKRPVLIKRMRCSAIWVFRPRRKSISAFSRKEWGIELHFLCDSGILFGMSRQFDQP